MGRVSGKIVVVTGGAKGIGEATAKLLAKEGAVVIIADIDEPKGKMTADQIKHSKGKAAFIKTDVSLENNWENLIEKTLSEFYQIDVLVNNAGLYLIKDVEKTTPEDIHKIFAVNFNGVLWGIKYCAPIMAKQGKGSIINMSSMDGIVGSVGHAVYGGSKGAVRILSKVAAIEYAEKKVRINSVHPGYIHTEMAEYGADKFDESLKELGKEFPLKHIGEPIDVAYGILYLASDESKFVTGSELVIDGGVTAKG